MCVRVLCAVRGVSVNEQALQRILAPGSHGETSLLQVNEALASHNIAMLAASFEVHEIERCPLPAVLFVKQTSDSPIGHFICAFKGAAAHSIIVVDPFVSSEPIEVPVAEVTQQWTGLALIPVDEAAIAMKERERFPWGLAVSAMLLTLVVLAQSIRLWRRQW